jgi:hypothetical protein
MDRWVSVVAIARRISEAASGERVTAPAVIEPW